MSGGVPQDCPECGRAVEARYCVCGWTLSCRRAGRSDSPRPDAPSTAPTAADGYVGKGRPDQFCRAKIRVALAEDKGLDRYAVAVYQCPQCEGFHVGNRSLNERLARLPRPPRRKKRPG